MKQKGYQCFVQDLQYLRYIVKAKIKHCSNLCLLSGAPSQPFNIASMYKLSKMCLMYGQIKMSLYYVRTNFKQNMIITKT